MRNSIHWFWNITDLLLQRLKYSHVAINIFSSVYFSGFEMIIRYIFFCKESDKFSKCMEKFLFLEAIFCIFIIKRAQNFFDMLKRIHVREKIRLWETLNTFFTLSFPIIFSLMEWNPIFHKKVNIIF